MDGGHVKLSTEDLGLINAIEAGHPQDEQMDDIRKIAGNRIDRAGDLRRGLYPTMDVKG